MNSPMQWMAIGLAIAFMTAVIVFVMSLMRTQAALDDRLDIEEAIALYAHRWDSKDAAAFAELFTEDTIVEVWALGARQSRIEGRSALLDYARQSHEGRLADRQTRHHMSGLVFTERSSDFAVTENRVLITHQTAEDATARVVHSGVYRNSWRKTDQGWKIAKRVFVADRVASPSETPRDRHED